MKFKMKKLSTSSTDLQEINNLLARTEEVQHKRLCECIGYIWSIIHSNNDFFQIIMQMYTQGMFTGTYKRCWLIMSCIN